MLRYVGMGLAALSLMYCNGPKTATCGSDNDCPGEELCLEGKCVGSCRTDYDCPGEGVCEGGRCTNERGSGSFVQPRAPSEAFNGFREALRGNDLERAVSYFSPHAQEKYLRILQQRDLRQLADTLPEISARNMDQANSSTNLIQYEVQIDNEEYAITFHCSHDICKIMQF